MPEGRRGDDRVRVGDLALNPLVRVRDWVRLVAARDDVAVTILIYFYGLSVVW